jgi:hypothetical protein
LAKLLEFQTVALAGDLGCRAKGLLLFERLVIQRREQAAAPEVRGRVPGVQKESPPWIATSCSRAAGGVAEGIEAVIPSQKRSGLHWWGWLRPSSEYEGQRPSGFPSDAGTGSWGDAVARYTIGRTGT